VSEAGEQGATVVRSRLSELTSKFVVRTRDDVAQMRAALARVSGGELRDLEQIHQLAHRACGTGGTLGLCALSDAAGALERQVEAIPADAMFGVAERTRIAAGIEALAAQLELL
jgi:HPt (histidine-containing phosphotransfer) domain-containing protein